MKCPWCKEWEGEPEEYAEHLEYCKKYPHHSNPTEEKPQKLEIDKTYTLKKQHTFFSQRTGDARLFNEKNIQLQIEGQRDNQVTVRGKYPNDDYFATIPAEDLEEHHSNPGEPENKPTLEELFKGKVLNGYLEASRVRTLEQFMPFTFLFDEGLPTEEKFTVTAINEFEASIKARDEFTKRRGTYHKTSKLVGT